MHIGGRGGERRGGKGDFFTPALSIEFHPSSNTLSSDVDSGMTEQLTSTSALPAIRAKVITLLIKHSCVREEGKEEGKRWRGRGWKMLIVLKISPLTSARVVTHDS